MGDEEALSPDGVESPFGYHPLQTRVLTQDRDPVRGHCQSDSLTGAVASQNVTEAFKGSLRMDGNHSTSTKAKASFTARPTSRADTKVGLSDPVAPRGRAIA